MMSEATGATPLVEMRNINKRFGGVRAVDDISVDLYAGEVLGILGANGAGKSTLVKILTGAVHPDSGRIVIRGQQRKVHSPSDARKNGLVPVYQEPALIPDLDVISNLRLTDTPVEPFMHHLHALGITRFSQIAAFDAEDITRVDDALAFKGRVERDDWIGQAKALAAETEKAA